MSSTNNAAAAYTAHNTTTNAPTPPPDNDNDNDNPSAVGNTRSLHVVESKKRGAGDADEESQPVARTKARRPNANAHEGAATYHETHKLLEHQPMEDGRAFALSLRTLLSA